MLADVVPVIETRLGIVGGVMPNVIAGTRVKLTIQFITDGAVFDPEVVTFTSVFKPRTIGLAEERVSYTFNVGASVVRSSAGNYYVEQLFETIGTLRFAWQSTAEGEEVHVEKICNIVPRSVL
jgi:hypothetical protein